MRRIELLCVGKIKEEYMRAGIAEYQKRLSRYADIRIIELADQPDTPRARERESEKILERLSGFTILTDIGGTPLSSEQLSQTIDRAFITHPKVQLIIGGSRGVTDEVRERADQSISFGRLTFPHMLMRLMVMEQLYRAVSILEGTGYHK